MTLAPAAAAVDEALDLLRSGPLVVLTGAGLSTDSGIPDYRGPTSTPRTPMTYEEFCSGPRRAAALLGTRPRRLRQVLDRRAQRRPPRAGPARPGAADHPERRRPPRGGRASAGSSRCTAGSPTWSASTAGPVRRASPSNAGWPQLNPGWRDAHADLVLRPDGDVELTETRGFVVPDCEACGGVLKPDVVFFGENVPAAAGRPLLRGGRRARRRGRRAAGGGSSLTVMSGLRFVSRAARAGTPVVIANRGATRGDDLRRRTGSTVGCSEFLDRASPAAVRQSGLREHPRTKMWSAASGTISAVSPPEPTSTPSSVRATVTVLSGSAPTRRSAPISTSSFCISSEIRRTCTRASPSPAISDSGLDTRP